MNAILKKVLEFLFKHKWLLIIAVIILIGLVIYYIKYLHDDTYHDGPSGIDQVEAVGDIPQRDTLPQAWDSQTREDFWYTSQGSQIMPYKWFMWLEQANSSDLFRSSDFMDALGYLPMESSEANPGGLPVGFAMTRPSTNHPDIMMGLTCSACHTNQIDFKGTKLLIEGAPTLANFVKLYSEIINALTETHKDNDKFKRFADNVLDEGYSEEEANALKASVKETADAARLRQAVNALPADYPPDFTSYARLDAFGNIANAGSAFALNSPSNSNPPTAPVSYPFLWGTHQSDVVQWNASAANTPVVGPLVRNVGEVVGVFGGLSIHEAPWWQKIFGIKVAYSSTVDYQGLGRLERWIKEMRSPAWPEEILGEINDSMATAGEILFDAHCVECHKVIKRGAEGNDYVSNKTLLTEIGTDPIMAWNVENHEAKTLLLQGIKDKIVAGDTFGIETDAIGLPVNGVVGVILKRPYSAIKAGLAPDRKEESTGFISSIKELISHLDIPELMKKNSTVRDTLHDYLGDKEHEKAPNALGQTGTDLNLDGLVYKGRPLNGIWATAPFLHNGSIPNLWELLQVPEERVDTFRVGSREFDPENVGFVTDEGPSMFHVLKQDSSNTIMPGNSNLGHNYGAELKDDEKWNLIEFMKTL